MSGGTRVPFEVARQIAQELAQVLRAACERIEVAGSLRRLKDDIGDIDLVCRPTIERTAGGLFGDEFTELDLLHDLTSSMAAQGTLERRLDKNGRATWGANLKRAVYRGLNVDIQAVTDDSTWGAWMLIRTGPAEFNKAIVTPKWQGGLLPSGFEWKNGFRLYRYGGRVETPTEHDVFAALGLPYVAPAERGADVPSAAVEMRRAGAPGLWDGEGT